VLSFGGTKNGAVGAEAVVVMTEELAVEAPFLRKQQGQLGSKMRYLAVQFQALLDDGLWLRNAGHANAMARRLAEGIHGVPGARLWQPVESNAVFVSLDPAQIARLQRDWQFYVWDAAAQVVRWMTAYDTTEADVDAFVAEVWRTSGA
jgi:threonine aldolase